MGAGRSEAVSGDSWRRAALSSVSLALLLLLFVAWRVSDAGRQLDYSIVIDCGSTGTRLYVYAWSGGGSASGALPRIHATNAGGSGERGRAYQRRETEPGLDHFVHDREGLRARALQPLLAWAEGQVPAEQRARTPLFLLATAGLRRLPPEASGWLLEEARQALRESAFRFRDEWARVISGADEAVYGWIALNYRLGQLGQGHEYFTLGALDLGGSSLEVTFVPQRIPRPPFSSNVSIGGGTYHLYAHSHAGFGMNDAFDRSVAALLQQREGSREGGEGPPPLLHPCLQRGYNRTYARAKSLREAERGRGPRSLLGVGGQWEAGAGAGAGAGGRRLRGADATGTPRGLEGEERAGGGAGAGAARAGSRSSGERGEDGGAGEVEEVQLQGAPDWARCQALAASVVQVAGPCPVEPCALGSHQPPLRGKFYALAGFFVVYHFLGLPLEASLDEVVEKGREFCGRPWEEVEAQLGEVRGVDRYCFRAPYVVALLREGLGLLDSQVQVGAGDIGWTLGAALYEGGAARGGEGAAALGHALDSGGEDGAGSSGKDNSETGVIVLVVVVGLAVVGTTLRHLKQRGSSTGRAALGRGAQGLSAYASWLADMSASGESSWSGSGGRHGSSAGAGRSGERGVMYHNPPTVGQRNKDSGGADSGTAGLRLGRPVERGQKSPARQSRGISRRAFSQGDMASCEHWCEPPRAPEARASHH